jgi:PAS domain S-box-containing protein
VEVEGIARDVTQRKWAEKRLAKLNECFLSFGSDSTRNINRLVALCGELLGATGALYSHLDGKCLNILGKWNIPSDFPLMDKAEGHLCYDVIRHNSSTPTVIQHLQKTPYVKTDPNVLRYGLKTYVGMVVRLNQVPVGTVCTVYQTDIEPKSQDLQMLSIVASAIGVEEDRRRAEETLRETNAKLQAVIEAAPVAVVSLDRQGRVTSWNKSAENMFGFAAEEVIGRPHPIVPDDKKEEFQTLFLQALQGRVLSGVELLRRRKDGSFIDVNLHTAPMQDAQGSIIGVMGVLVDITARKRDEAERLALERKLLDAQKLESLSVMAGGIAHDFNNLLTVILGNASLAAMEIAENSPVRPHLDNIEKASLQAAELCKHMLAYAGRGRFLLQRMDLNSLLEELRHFFNISLNVNISLNIDLAQDPLPVEADSAQLRQLVVNLVNNAAEAIGDQPGSITIRTGLMQANRAYLAQTVLAPDLAEGQYVFLEVTDTGCGMSPETQAKIFDPFFSTKFTGRGLGLAAALGIVRGHKGALEVASQLGHGTTFKILLPCIETPAQESDISPAPSKSWQGRGTILVVDDEADVRTVTSGMLQSLGFDVLTASDGQAGLETFQRHADQIIIVLLDLAMPKMNGVEAFREMHRLRSSVPVLLMSGYSESLATERFGDQGPAGFLQKPFKGDDLHAKLSSVLQDKA